MRTSKAKLICAAAGVLALLGAGAASAHDRHGDDHRHWKERGFHHHHHRGFDHRHRPRVVRERVVVVRPPVVRERRVVHYEPVFVPPPPRDPAIVVSFDLPPLVFPLR